MCLIIAADLASPLCSRPLWPPTKHCFLLPQLRSASTHFIAATHTTPFKGYRDELNFQLTSYNFFTCCHVSVGFCSPSWHFCHRLSSTLFYFISSVWFCSNLAACRPCPSLKTGTWSETRAPTTATCTTWWKVRPQTNWGNANRLQPTNNDQQGRGGKKKHLSLFNLALLKQEVVWLRPEVTKRSPVTSCAPSAPLQTVQSTDTDPCGRRWPAMSESF